MISKFRSPKFRSPDVQHLQHVGGFFYPKTFLPFYLRPLLDCGGWWIGGLVIGGLVIGGMVIGGLVIGDW